MNESITNELNANDAAVFKTYEIKTPPTANWRFYFGDSPNTYFQFYIKTPPNRFQRWMIEKVFGIRWEKV